MCFNITVVREDEFKQQHTQKVKSEYGMNNRKLRYNRGSASEAVVSNVRTCTADVLVGVRVKM